MHEAVDLWDITFCTRRFWGFWYYWNPQILRPRALFHRLHPCNYYTNTKRSILKMTNYQKAFSFSSHIQTKEKKSLSINYSNTSRKVDGQWFHSFLKYGTKIRYFVRFSCIYCLPFPNRKSLNYKPGKYFVAFCSFFPCSLTVFHRGRQRKKGGRQWKSSRADKQHCFP